MTYKEDKADVVKAFKELIAAGVYKEKLFDCCFLERALSDTGEICTGRCPFYEREIASYHTETLRRVQNVTGVCYVAIKVERRRTQLHEEFLKESFKK